MSKVDGNLEPLFRLLDFRKLGQIINGNTADVRTRLSQDADFMSKIADLVDQAAKLKLTVNILATNVMQSDTKMGSTMIPYTPGEINTVTNAIAKILVALYNEDKGELIKDAAAIIRKSAKESSTLDDVYVKKCCLRFRNDTDKDSEIFSSMLIDIVTFYFYSNQRNKVSDVHSKNRMSQVNMLLNDIIKDPKRWANDLCNQLHGSKRKMDFSKYIKVNNTKPSKGMDIFVNNM